MSKIEENVYNTLLQSIHHNYYTVKDLESFYSQHGNVKIRKLIYAKTGDSIIHVCARLGRTDFLDYIFNNWDSNVVDIKNNDDKTPLHEACQFIQYDVVKLLIKHKATINAIKRADWTPLMLACTKTGEDTLKIIKLLIENGAILDLRNKDGWTVLHLACREGDYDIVQILLENDKDIIKLKTKNGRTCLHIAALHGHLKIVKYLIGYINPNEKDNSGNNILHEATFSNNREIIDILLLNNCDINSVNSVGFTCLHLAASEGLTELIKYFICVHKLNINVKSFQDLTPLHCAARKKQKKALEMLIQMGANVTIKDIHERIADNYLGL